jgi:hypothetical protein
MFPHCTTASRIWMSRNLIRRPMRSDHAIGLPVIVSHTANENRRTCTTTGRPENVREL